MSGQGAVPHPGGSMALVTYPLCTYGTPTVYVHILRANCIHATIQLYYSIVTESQLSGPEDMTGTGQDLSSSDFQDDLLLPLSLVQVPTVSPLEM